MRVVFLAALVLLVSATSGTVQGAINNAASQTSGVAKAAAGTIASGVKQESMDVAKIVGAILKQILGDANYKQLMALIGQVVKNIQLAIANVQKQAQAAVGKLTGSSKPIDALWEELNAGSTISSAAAAGAATAASAAKTVETAGLKELQLVVKVAEAVLKSLIGSGAYQAFAAMIKKLFSSVQAAVKQVAQAGQGFVAGVGKAMSGKAFLQELSAQSTVAGAVANGVSTAQNSAKALFADAQKEVNLVVKVLEAIIKQILGATNYKQLLAMINFLISAARNAATQVAAAGGKVVSGLAGVLGGSKKPVLDFQDASTSSTIPGAVNAGAATAASAAKTVAADAQKELGLAIKILEAVLKQIIGESNYKMLIGMIAKLIAQAKAAVGQAQKNAAQIVAGLQKQIGAAVAGIMKQAGGSAAVSGSKPFDDFFQEASTASTISSAAAAGAATAQSAGKTVVSAATKELGLAVKVLEAILKQIVGEANYKAIMGMIAQVIAQLKAAAGKAQAAAAQGVKQLQGFVAGIMKSMNPSSSKPLMFEDLSAQSTIQSAVSSGAATAASGAKALAVDAQKELNLAVKVLEAVLKSIIGESNYKLLIGMIAKLIAQAKAAVGQAQKSAAQIVAGLQKQIGAAVAGVMKLAGGSTAGASSKPLEDIFLQEASTASTISSAAAAGAATAQSAGKTIVSAATKELGLAVKVLEAILKQIVGEANYKTIMGMIAQVIAQLKAAAGKAQAAAAQGVKQLQGFVGGIVKSLNPSSTKPLMFEDASTQSTIQSAVSAGAATAASGAKALAADAQKELNLVIKVLEAVLKSIIGENNYKLLIGFINQIIAQLKATAQNAQKAAAQAAKQIQGYVAGIMKQVTPGAGSGSAKPFMFEDLSTVSTIQNAVSSGAATAASGAKTLAADAQKELNLVIKVLEAILKQIIGENNYKLLMAAINQIITQLKATAKNAETAAAQAAKQVQGAIAGIVGAGSPSSTKPFSRVEQATML